MNTSSGDSKMIAIPQKHPLLISTIVTRILEPLPLGDMKNGRLICREWNSLAEPLLRKKAKILITPKFGTSDFFEYYSNSCLAAVPFTAFKFTNYVDSTKGFLVSDLDDFFKKCGKNIKSLELEHINIWKDKEDLQRMEAMNINPWIETLSDNMDKITINVNRLSTRLTLNLENLAGVKSLTLSQCDVIVNSSDINRLTPSEISLTGVTFLDQSKTALTDVIVNEFVDFSNCSNIKLYKLYSKTDINFDMSKDTVEAKEVEFTDIQVLNSIFSKIKTDFLSVFCKPSEAIKMRMKKLDIKYCSSMNLTHLPQTIEKLKMKRNECVRDDDDTVPLDLPNLKYLHLDEPAEGYLPLSDLKMISWFKNCSNLVDVHLGQLGWTHALDVSWLPRSIKRLKLTEIKEIVFVGDSPSIDVDVLLSDESVNSLAVERIMEKIIPKMLVRIVAFHKDGGWRRSDEMKEKAEDFISFLQRNTQLEKIVINTLNGLDKAGSSDRNSFLQFVGEESLCFEFNNHIAKAISKEEFEKYYDINCMKNSE